MTGLFDRIDSMKRLCHYFSLFEKILWSISILTIIILYIIFPGDVLSFLASLIGATSLIFLAKGHFLTHILTIAFSVLYAIVSYQTRYYSELITYAGMTLPLAIIALVSWLRHPFKDKKEVEVATPPIYRYGIVLLLGGVATFGFYFLLKYLQTPYLIIATISIFTSFVACGLSILRSPYYALVYALNDIVLIVLWSIQLKNDFTYLSMVINFSVFLVNDIYGFINWRRIQAHQKKEKATADFFGEIE